MLSCDDDGSVVDLMLPPSGPWVCSHLLDTGLCVTSDGEYIIPGPRDYTGVLYYTFKFLLFKHTLLSLSKVLDLYLGNYPVANI